MMLKNNIVIIKVIIQMMMMMMMMMMMITVIIIFKFIMNIDFYCSSFVGSHQISRFWSLHGPQESTQNRILQRNIT